MDEQIDLGEPEKGNGRKIWIALLALLLIGIIAIYVSGGSLKSLVFGLSSGEGEKVGITKAVTGQLKRQPKDSLEFIDVKVSADLYNEDTVMTGPDDQATIELFDGSQLELDPGSLIRLSFEDAKGVSGIERRVLIDVVAGNVKGEMNTPKTVVRKGGKPVAQLSPRTGVMPSATPSPTPTAEPSPEPSPTPSPTPSPSPTPELSTETIRITQPTPGQVITLAPGQLPPVKQAIVFESPSLPDVSVMMILKNASGKEALRKTVTAVKGRGGILATFERPGSFSIELRSPDGTKIGRGIRTAFKIAAEFEAIELEPALVGGEPIDSNRFTGKRLQDFDVSLRWKPLEKIGKYNIVVTSQAGKQMIDANVVTPNFSLMKGKLPTDELTYQVRADLPSGYTAVSKKGNFLFNFTSPPQTLPQSGTSVSLTNPEVVKQKGILFSWQRTTFTHAYEFEIASDEAFADIKKRAAVKPRDNFIVFRNLKPGQYWWRIRAVNGTLRSPPTKGFKITVTP